MNRIYRRLRIALLSFTLGLATVYMWNGISIGMSVIPVDLPKLDSKEEVLFIFPSTARDASPFYIPKEGEIVNGRDLSLYDEGGYFESCDQVEENEWAGCLKQREAARRFVFEHWAERRRGYIQIAHPCVDCSPVDHIFIETHRNNKWRVIITRETNAPLRTQVAWKLRFRQANDDEKWRSDSATILVFIDRNGNEIDYF